MPKEDGRRCGVVVRLRPRAAPSQEATSPPDMTGNSFMAATVHGLPHRRRVIVNDPLSTTHPGDQSFEYDSVFPEETTNAKLFDDVCAAKLEEALVEVERLRAEIKREQDALASPSDSVVSSSHHRDHHHHGRKEEGPIHRDEQADEAMTKGPQQRPLKVEATVCVMAYGHTNSGKTHTVVGWNDDARGERPTKSGAQIPGTSTAQDVSSGPRVLTSTVNRNPLDAGLNHSVFAGEGESSSPVLPSTAGYRVPPPTACVEEKEEGLLPKAVRWMLDHCTCVSGPDDQSLAHASDALRPSSSSLMVKSSDPSQHLEVTLIEIYGDKVYDLLAPNAPECKIRRTSKRPSVMPSIATPVTLPGSATTTTATSTTATVPPAAATSVTAVQPMMFVEGLTRVRVTSFEEWLDRCQSAVRSRRTSSTESNDRSSRSHALFTLRAGGVSLCLVDLAGSERQGPFAMAAKTPGDLDFGEAPPVPQRHFDARSKEDVGRIGGKTSNSNSMSGAAFSKTESFERTATDQSVRSSLSRSRSDVDLQRDPSGSGNFSAEKSRSFSASGHRSSVASGARGSAGMERSRKASAAAWTALSKESIAINKSLSALSTVVQALSKPTPSSSSSAKASHASAGHHTRTSKSTSGTKSAPPSSVPTALKPGVSIAPPSTATSAVVTATSAASAASFVNYRDSTLTQLLQRYLAGNSRTVFIGCVHPDPENVAETLSTLKYAQRLVRVKPAQSAVVSLDVKTKVKEKTDRDQHSDVVRTASLKATQSTKPHKATTASRGHSTGRTKQAASRHARESQRPVATDESTKSVDETRNAAKTIAAIERQSRNAALRKDIEAHRSQSLSVSPGRRDGRGVALSSPRSRSHNTSLHHRHDDGGAKASADHSRSRLFEETNDDANETPLGLTGASRSLGSSAKASLSPLSVSGRGARSTSDGGGGELTPSTANRVQMQSLAAEVARLQEQIELQKAAAAHVHKAQRRKIEDLEGEVDHLRDERSRSASLLFDASGVDTSIDVSREHDRGDHRRQTHTIAEASSAASWNQTGPLPPRFLAGGSSEQVDQQQQHSVDEHNQSLPYGDDDDADALIPEIPNAGDFEAHGSRSTKDRRSDSCLLVDSSAIAESSNGNTSGSVLHASDTSLVTARLASGNTTLDTTFDLPPPTETAAANITTSKHTKPVVTLPSSARGGSDGITSSKLTQQSSLAHSGGQREGEQKRSDVLDELEREMTLRRSSHLSTMNERCVSNTEQSQDKQHRQEQEDEEAQHNEVPLFTYDLRCDNFFDELLPHRRVVCYAASKRNTTQSMDDDEAEVVTTALDFSVPLKCDSSGVSSHHQGASHRARWLIDPTERPENERATKPDRTCAHQGSWKSVLEAVGTFGAPESAPMHQPLECALTPFTDPGLSQALRSLDESKSLGTTGRRKAAAESSARNGHRSGRCSGGDGLRVSITAVFEVPAHTLLSEKKTTKRLGKFAKRSAEIGDAEASVDGAVGREGIRQRSAMTVDALLHLHHQSESDPGHQVLSHDQSDIVNCFPFLRGATSAQSLSKMDKAVLLSDGSWPCACRPLMSSEDLAPFAVIVSVDSATPSHVCDEIIADITHDHLTPRLPLSIDTAATEVKDVTCVNTTGQPANPLDAFQAFSSPTRHGAIAIQRDDHGTSRPQEGDSAVLSSTLLQQPLSPLNGIVSDVTSATFSPTHDDVLTPRDGNDEGDDHGLGRLQDNRQLNDREVDFHGNDSDYHTDDHLNDGDDGDESEIGSAQSDRSHDSHTSVVLHVMTIEKRGSHLKEPPSLSSSRRVFVEQHGAIEHSGRSGQRPQHTGDMAENPLSRKLTDGARRPRSSNEDVDHSWLSEKQHQKPEGEGPLDDDDVDELLSSLPSTDKATLPPTPVAFAAASAPPADADLAPFCLSSENTRPSDCAMLPAAASAFSNDCGRSGSNGDGDSPSCHGHATSMLSGDHRAREQQQSRGEVTETVCGMGIHEATGFVSTGTSQGALRATADPSMGLRDSVPSQAVDLVSEAHDEAHLPTPTTPKSVDRSATVERHQAEEQTSIPITARPNTAERRRLVSPLRYDDDDDDETFTLRQNGPTPDRHSFHDDDDHKNQYHPVQHHRSGQSPRHGSNHKDGGSPPPAATGDTRHRDSSRRRRRRRRHDADRSEGVLLTFSDDDHEGGAERRHREKPEAGERRVMPPNVGQLSSTNEQHSSAIPSALNSATGTPMKQTVVHKGGKKRTPVKPLSPSDTRRPLGAVTFDREDQDRRGSGPRRFAPSITGTATSDGLPVTEGDGDRPRVSARVAAPAAASMAQVHPPPAAVPASGPSTGKERRASKKKEGAKENDDVNDREDKTKTEKKSTGKKEKPPRRRRREDEAAPGCADCRMQ